MAKSKHQTFEMVTISRKEINPAPYNPRFMDDANRKALAKGLKQFGLAQPLVWNKRTKNLVSGHQRLEQLDKLEGNLDYELDVAAVDLTERDEVKLNVQFNNSSMQGAFDTQALADLALSQELDFADLGFSNFDAQLLFGDLDDQYQSLFPDTEEVTAVKTDIQEAKERRKEMMEKYKEEQTDGNYFVVVCETNEEKERLLKAMSLPAYETTIRSTHLDRLHRKDKK